MFKHRFVEIDFGSRSRETIHAQVPRSVDPLMNLIHRSFAVLFLLTSLAVTGSAAIPGRLHYQGRILVGPSAFNGPGGFKFALVDESSAALLWANSPDANFDGQPDAAVTLTLNRGLYSVLLGDTNLMNMAPLSSEVFTNRSLFLRVWFNDGTNGFELLAPDHQLGSVGHAILAANVEDGAITAPKLAPGLLDLTNFSGTVSASQLPPNLAQADAKLTALSNQVSALSNRLYLAEAQLAAVGPNASPVVSADPLDAGLIGQGYTRFMSVAAPGWTTGNSDNQPSPRHGHAAVWAGSKWFIWGGTLGAGTFSGSGALYDPAEDAWATVSTLDAPGARTGAKAAWSGSEVFVFGGSSSTGFTNSGGRYNPNTLAWTLSPTTNAPVSRDGHALVWTGSAFLVFGGRNQDGLLNDLALFDPVSNTWSALSRPNAPVARFNAVVIWTGDRLLVWGGEGEGGFLGDGAQLIFTNGVASHWQAISSTGAPSARTTTGAVWTGTKLLVWGGYNGGPLGGGAFYDPATDIWETLPATGAPSARNGHAVAWTGQELLVVGGETASGVTATGAALNPATSQWRTLTTQGGPAARMLATAVWTGDELLVYGGRSGAAALASLQRLVPQPAWYFYRKP
jgi:N-acetylneuraminic acid mutarotase